MASASVNQKGSVPAAVIIGARLGASWQRQLVCGIRRPRPLWSAQLALLTWDNEGGAGARGPQVGSISDDALSEAPPLTNTELVQLRIRVIALENLVITLLVEASARQLDLAREMATYIAPRPGFTAHPLTVHAAARMVDIVERASRFRGEGAGKDASA